MTDMKEKDKDFFIYTADQTPNYIERSRSLQVMMLEEEMPRNSE